MKSVFKGFILLILSLILIPQAIKAQDWEYGVSVGTSGYMGEYNLDNIFKFNSLSGSIGAKYNFNPTWGVKVEFSRLGIKGDPLNEYLSGFKKTLSEISIRTEFNFFKFEPNKKVAAYTPYVFLGLGIGGFNYLKLLEEESVEGEEQEKYVTIKQYKPAVLFGAGFKYNLKSNFTIDTHLAYRIVSTDILDDKGSGWDSGVLHNINNVDSYMTFQIGITYTFFKQGCPTW